MCVSGLRPTPIAKRLRSEKVLTPTEYWNSIGRKCSKLHAVTYNWCAATVADILDKQEYCGDTVNFRTTSKSFRLKKRLERPQEDWQIFENTHLAIIHRETFELVQELRQHRRRPTKSGIVSMFSGLLYCADCGEKLYYSVTDNYKRDKAYFFCPLTEKTLMCALPTVSGKRLWSSLYLRVCRGYYGMCRVTKSYSHKGSWRNLARSKRKSLLKSAGSLKTQKSEPKDYRGLLTKQSRLPALKLSRPNWYTNSLRKS